MATIESNILPILNLPELASTYKLYRIRGLDADHPDYYLNRDHLGWRISYLLRIPALVIERDQVPYLVMPADAPEPPSPFMVVMGQVAFERTGNNFEIDFTQRSPETDAICLRFLQFTIQAPLHGHPNLWQPRSGGPFYEKKPVDSHGEIVSYRGFSVRAMVAADGGIGLCVDVATCYASATSLPADLSRDEFQRRWKGRRFVYHFGHNWYEIRAEGLSDFSTSQHMLSRDGRTFTLLNYLLENSRKPLPPELANLSPDAAVVIYRDNRGSERAAPAPLCYAVYGTEDPQVARHHSRAQLPPRIRRLMIHQYARRYLARLRFGSVLVRVSAQPLAVPNRVFQVPDLRFGHGALLSVRGTPGAQQIGLDRLGAVRLTLLQDRSAGFYEAEALYRQYLILPRSALESYGSRFIEDLKRSLNSLYPGGGYSPQIVAYDDGVPRKFVPQARVLLKAFDELVTESGYALVMIHPMADRLLRQEDELSAFVLRELRKRDVQAAVIHTETPGQCYELVNDGTRGPSYVSKDGERGRLDGYLRNVALNKVLLTNRRLPFLLATRLHADLVVGIDVKNHTAGLAVLDAYGGLFLANFRESKQKERLLEDQIKVYLIEVIRTAAQHLDYLPRHMVIHRDGRVFLSEIRGARKAIAALAREGILHAEATLTLVEISETAPAPLRIFDVSERSGSKIWVENPTIGTYFIASNRNGYLCTTGRPLLAGVRGTVRPLHVRLVEGALSLEDCLEDVFFLSSLTWTRPEGCMRAPITIKLLDRFLLERGTEYDEDQLEFESEPEAEEVAR